MQFYTIIKNEFRAYELGEMGRFWGPFVFEKLVGGIETTQEWLGHTSTAHTRAYIDAEDYREKANGVVAGLDI